MTTLEQLIESGIRIYQEEVARKRRERLERKLELKRKREEAIRAVKSLYPECLHEYMGFKFDSLECPTEVDVKFSLPSGGEVLSHAKKMLNTDEWVISSNGHPDCMFFAKPAGGNHRWFRNLEVAVAYAMGDLRLPQKVTISTRCHC